MPSSDDPDATVELRRPPASPAAPSGATPSASTALHRSDAALKRRLALLAVAAAAFGALFWGLQDSTTQTPPPTQAFLPARESSGRPALVPEPPVAQGPGVGSGPSAARAGDPPLMGETEILPHRAALPTMVRLRGNPRVFVLLFPDLETQGAALNRVAALVEKAGPPRDRVLTDAELAAAIARAKRTPADYLHGHDYRGAALARFFALADRDGVAMGEAERWVRERFERARSLVPDGEVSLVSMAAANHRQDAAARAAVLRHEIGHGHYFTRPDYAAHVLRVWREAFSGTERAAVRRFLAKEGYDADNEDLAANEAQAYLLYTPDPRLFSARDLGLPEWQAERMRALLREGSPLPREE